MWLRSLTGNFSFDAPGNVEPGRLGHIEYRTHRFATDLAENGHSPTRPQAAPVARIEKPSSSV